MIGKMLHIGKKLSKARRWFVPNTGGESGGNHGARNILKFSVLILETVFPIVI